MENRPECKVQRVSVVKGLLGLYDNCRSSSKQTLWVVAPWMPAGMQVTHNYQGAFLGEKMEMDTNCT